MRRTDNRRRYYYRRAGNKTPQQAYSTVDTSQRRDTEDQRCSYSKFVVDTCAQYDPSNSWSGQGGCSYSFTGAATW